jgi:hypothetical protein
MDLDVEWETFLKEQNTGEESSLFDKNKNTCESEMDEELDIPKCEDLSISTNTKVLFLNEQVDINNVFWKIHISDYQTQDNCVIKKQIKIVNHTVEEYEEYIEKLKSLKNYKENIIKQINNPDARRNKFKDERKLTIGISKKDILTTKVKTKNAFYNCFAITIRFIHKQFHEIHVKVFNTGKLEIPGIVDSSLLDIIKTNILNILTPLISDKLTFINTDQENNVLINSNFNCGFHIKRDVLYNILKNKYNIETSYDSCSYPGVKSKYYYNMYISNDEQTGQIDNTDSNMKTSDIEDSKKYCEVSFMVFRTGSCLIVGNCNEEILYIVYNFIKDVLQNEYKLIRVPDQGKFIKEKKSKIKKIKYIIDYEYHNSILTSMKN